MSKLAQLFHPTKRFLVGRVILEDRRVNANRILRATELRRINMAQFQAQIRSEKPVIGPRNDVIKRRGHRFEIAADQPDTEDFIE